MNGATIDITGIVLGILGLAFTAFGTWFSKKVIPWIKARTSKAQWDFWLTVVTTAVRAAEEIYRYEGQGEAKFAYVEDALQKAAGETHPFLSGRIANDFSKQ